MCGIYGTFHPSDAKPIQPLEWERTGEALRRRGPDGGGVWCNGRALIGARRLAIMDPQARADMPMASRDGRFILAFNGELYDHLLHRRLLSQRGWRFSTASDTETVLAALAIHGPSVLDELNGMFALAFYDASEHHLLLARDHAGIKPLYVSDAGGAVAFCSEFDTLLASPAGIARDVDPVALVQYLDFGHVPAPRSLVRNVAMLEPGESRLYLATGHHRRRFDRLRDETAGYVDDDEAGDAFDASLRAAVIRQSRSDADVGFLLSGGIDSRLLACFGADVADAPIRTFSIRNEAPLDDEGPAAAAEARLLNARHHDVTMSSAECEALFADAIAAIHEPIADEGVLPSLLVSRLACQSVRVVLSGEGADELLFGYDYRHSTADWSTGTASSRPQYLEHYREFDRADFDACFPSAARLRAESDTPSAWSAMSDEPMEWMRSTELHTYLPFVLLKTDRATMFHSIEARVPYLDKDVIRTALRIRPSALFDRPANRGKRISRRLLERRGRNTGQPKRGFTAPVEHWLRGPLRSALDTTLARLAGLSALPVETTAIARMAQDHCAGRVDRGMALWRLVVLDHWAARTGF